MERPGLDRVTAFCAKSQTALKGYLDKQVESGVITPAERTSAVLQVQLYRGRQDQPQEAGG